MSYKVVKVFNNNVILAKKNKEEMILVGRGIGFKKKSGDIFSVDSNTIEKVFHQKDEGGSSSYLDMISQYKSEVIGVTEEIISEAKKILGPLTPNIHMVLVDHITFALDRINMGLPIENPFTEEIILLYSKEYEVAELASNLLKERLGTDIGDDEKGFIALHLHSAHTNKTIRETMKDTRLVKACVDIIEQQVSEITYNNKDYIYQGFIPNIKLILNLARHQENIKNPLTKEIKSKIKESYNIAKKISNLVEKEDSIILSEEMIAYISMDIEKIRQF